MATVAQNIETLNTIKNDIKTAINDKGVTVTDSDSFTLYASKIDQIKQGEGGDSKINMKKEGIKFAYSNITEVPEWADWDGITDISYMFNNCSNLTTIPFIDTSNVTDAKYLFSSCKKLKTIPLLDFSKVTDLYYCFSYCSELTTIPQINTSSVVTFYNCFSNCIKLTTIPPIDTSKANDVGNMFSTCNSLQSLPLLDFSSLNYRIGYMFGYSDIYTLTDLGGFKNLKIDWNDNNGLYRLPNLTYQSIMNVINNLYNFRGNGDESTTRTLKINSKTYALLSEDDIGIATKKGWIISK